MRYNFRIYPNKQQEELIQKTFGCCRFVYNYFLQERMEQYKNEKTSPSLFQQLKNLTVLKSQLDWLNEVDSTALKNSVKRLNAAYKNFFNSGMSGKYYGKPKFKSKHSRRNSYQSSINKTTIRLLEKHVRLPKLGLVKCKVSKEIKGRILNATVIQNPSGKYFISICCTDVELEPLSKTGAVAGVDLGIKNLAITSDGIKYPNYKYFAKSEKKLAKLQRQLSRKSKGSKRREKARIKVARLHEKISNQRKDNLHKVTTEIIKNYDIIAIEDLVPSNMIKNPKLAKSISDSSFGEFRRKLEYKANWYDKVIVVIDRFFPSSQLCSNCGEKWPGTKNLSVRKWTCPNCGFEHDRDINAATNILNEGLRMLV